MTRIDENQDRLSRAVRQLFTGLRVVVIGDLILDRSLWGEVTRMSPEAPVPIVRLTRESHALGGAANVALNLRRLGAEVALAGYVGDDENGERLKELLARHAMSALDLVTVPGRPTVTKTRIWGEKQQMLRLDVEETCGLNDDQAEGLERAVTQRLRAGLDEAVILSDYAKGTLHPRTCRAVIDAARSSNRPVLVDPKGISPAKYRGASLLSPNLMELSAMTGVSSADLGALLRAGEELRSSLDLPAMVITRGSQGMTLLTDNQVQHVPAVAREVFDVSGAGDTVIAVLALGALAGLTLFESAQLANIAGGIVVSKLGTAPLERYELIDALTIGASQADHKVLSLEDLLGKIDDWRRDSCRIVFSNGCFDLLHMGHVVGLGRARQLGDRLIVALNDDASVCRLKGQGHPMNPAHARARMLAALSAVDAVVVFEHDTPLELIQRVRPDVLVKGGDYAIEQVIGATEVRSWGGEVVLIPIVEGFSSSELRSRLHTGVPDPRLRGPVSWD